MKKSILTLVFLLTTVALTLCLVTAQAQTSGSTIKLYAGEKSTSSYGFGSSAGNIQSPGPTITLVKGQSVTVTVYNVGTMPHNWAIVNAKQSTAAVQWNAQIDSAGTPIPAGGNGTVTFTPTTSGSYYYICQVDGHVGLGMWGNVTVNSSIPEFPAPLLIVFLAAALTAMAAYFSKVKIRRVKPI